MPRSNWKRSQKPWYLIRYAVTYPVKLSPNPKQRIIKDVKCGEENRFECNGFLEEWVTHETGEFQQIRNSIVEGRGDESQLIADVITYTDDNLKTPLVIWSRSKITSYKGFFLKKRGFKVNDVPAIKQFGCKESCEGSGHDPEPRWLRHSLKGHDLKLKKCRTWILL